METVLSSVSRKRTGSLVACDYCRRLHEKCDGNSPCERCTRRNKVCSYAGNQEKPKKKPRNNPPPLLVSAVALGADSSTEKIINRLKEAARYRSKAMRLIQSTLMCSGVDGARLAKYQIAMFHDGLVLMPTLSIPDPRYLEAAMGPIENHTTADQIISAAEHLLTVAFGSLLYGDIEFTMKHKYLAKELIGRLCDHHRYRLLTDISFRALILRTFLSLLHSILGEVKVASTMLQSLIDDWEQRDKSFDPPSEKYNDILCRAYSMKWTFFGEEKALHTSRSLARDSGSPAGALTELAFRHCIRRLHTDHPATIRASVLLHGDDAQFQLALKDWESQGLSNEGMDSNIAVCAIRSMLHMDAGLKAAALSLVATGIALAQKSEPAFQLSFNIPASISIMHKVSFYCEHAELTLACENEISKWQPHFPCVSGWENLTKTLHTLSTEQHMITIRSSTQQELLSYRHKISLYPSSESSTPSADQSSSAKSPLGASGEESNNDTIMEPLQSLLMLSQEQPIPRETDQEIWSSEWESAAASAVGLTFDEDMNLFFAQNFS